MKKGERYRILNTNMAAETVNEGIAELIKLIDSGDQRVQRWVVKFENGDVVDRFVCSSQIIKEE